MIQLRRRRKRRRGSSRERRRIFSRGSSAWVLGEAKQGGRKVSHPNFGWVLSPSCPQGRRAQLPEVSLGLQMHSVTAEGKDSIGRWGGPRDGSPLRAHHSIAYDSVSPKLPFLCTHTAHLLSRVDPATHGSLHPSLCRAPQITYAAAQSLSATSCPPRGQGGSE